MGGHVQHISVLCNKYAVRLSHWVWQPLPHSFFLHKPTHLHVSIHNSFAHKKTQNTKRCAHRNIMGIEDLHLPVKPFSQNMVLTLFHWEKYLFFRPSEPSPPQSSPDRRHQADCWQVCFCVEGHYAPPERQQVESVSLTSHGLEEADLRVGMLRKRTEENAKSARWKHILYGWKTCSSI